ncbi:MAG TPA: hypothetical protein VFU47_09410 [Armatimonadota bacterium]|nr:hypothetical protein [Armatimonadota bacterium]
MTQRRRKTGWLALLALIAYALAPLLAACAPGYAAPAVCLVNAVHSCSCRVGPHAPGDCCCDEKPAPPTSQVGKLPCDGGPSEDGSLWTAAHPLALAAPASGTITPAPRRAPRSSRSDRAASHVRIPASPPPQA